MSVSVRFLATRGPVAAAAAAAARAGAMLASRGLTTSAAHQFPRRAFRPNLDTNTYAPPKPEMMEALQKSQTTTFAPLSAAAEAAATGAYPPRTAKRHAGAGAGAGPNRRDFRVRQTPREKRSVSDVNTSLPLPTHWTDLARVVAAKAAEASTASPASASAAPSTTKGQRITGFYQVALMRSTIGLPETTRRVVQALGLTKRYQVVWLGISPQSAGMILRVKELVDVKVVDAIPPKPVRPQGFTVVGNKLARATAPVPVSKARAAAATGATRTPSA